MNKNYGIKVLIVYIDDSGCFWPRKHVGFWSGLLLKTRVERQTNNHVLKELAHHTDFYFNHLFCYWKKTREEGVLRRCKDMWAAYNRLKMSPHILMQVNMNACVCVCVCLLLLEYSKHVHTSAAHSISDTHTRVLGGGGGEGVNPWLLVQNGPLKSNFVLFFF